MADVTAPQLGGPHEIEPRIRTCMITNERGNFICPMNSAVVIELRAI